MAKQPHSARHSSQFLVPGKLHAQSFARIMQENRLFYGINPTKLRHFTPDLRRPRKPGITNAARP